jgi:hypothetical protein
LRGETTGKRAHEKGAFYKKTTEKHALPRVGSLTPDCLHDRIFSIDGGKDPFGFYKQNDIKNNKGAFCCGKNNSRI